MSNETRRILLVEDEKAIRDAVAAYLERENYWVTAVGDGQEASKNFPNIISTWSCSTSCFPACRASACAVHSRQFRCAYHHAHREGRG